MSSETTNKNFSNLETPGYVGFANLPNQVHRKSVKKGFEFTLMVVGESGLGKSTLVNSLFLTDLYPERVIPDAIEKTNQTVKLDASTVEIEERGVKLRLTVVDTPGYVHSMDDIRQCSQCPKWYHEECVGLSVDDYDDFVCRGGCCDPIRVNAAVVCRGPCFEVKDRLKPLDIEFMKQLHNKVNIVPVIAKADCLTKKEVQRLKTRVMEEIEREGIKIYPLPDCDSDEDEDYKEQVCTPIKGSGTVRGVRRGNSWRCAGAACEAASTLGVVEVENPEHCDFIKLRTMLITHMQDLQEVTQEVHYENYRSERLARSGQVPKRHTSTESGLSEADSNGLTNGSEDPSDRERALREK
ncbi:hypothetical protein HW555_013068, partial [Spodoptera exigua]